MIVARRISAGFPLAVALGLTTWELLRHTPLATHWWFDLPDIFALWFELPLLLLGLILALVWQRRALLWLLVPLAIIAAQYGPLFLPRSAVAASGTPLRIMTANLLVESDVAGSLERTLAQEQPDLVALQELDGDVAAVLSTTLRRRYPYQELFPEQHPFGSGIISRYPIVQAGQREEGPGSCFCQQVTLDWDGRRAVLINTHPYPPRIHYERLGPIYPIPSSFDDFVITDARQRLLRRVETVDGPLLLVGDFNTSDREAGYRQLGAALHDSYREGGGLGYTFPAGRADSAGLVGQLLLPFIRIDYIWYNAAWSARAAWTGHLNESDHRYVIADLVLR